jgi:hypothetical protein
MEEVSGEGHVEDGVGVMRKATVAMVSWEMVVMGCSTREIGRGERSGKSGRSTREFEGEKRKWGPRSDEGWENGIRRFDVMLGRIECMKRCRAQRGVDSKVVHRRE